MTREDDRFTNSANPGASVAPGLANGVNRSYLLHHRVCPKALGERGGTLVLAAAPGAFLDSCIVELERAYEATISVEMMSWPAVEAMIERLHASDARRGNRAAGGEEVEIEGEGAPDPTTTVADVRGLAAQPPVVRYVSLLLRDALDAGASDIHLEAEREGLRSRLRIDGVLTAGEEAPAHLGLAIISRIKLLAELDIAERRKPQDGRIRVRLDHRELDVRVSTVPTSYGESVVLRILDGSHGPMQLTGLGMPFQVQSRIGDIARRPHGLLLATGPTGSGKTTTLYACLQQRALHAEKVITIEDPIEYQLESVTQVPVHRQGGVTFASALRSVLRQDPDVVMVGEMRDGETAQVAVQAAMTGHLVLSTLHTNDAVGAIPRLLDLGVQAYLVGSTLEAVIAQRLVRRICESCRVARVLSAEVSEEVRSLSTFFGESSFDARGEYSQGLGCEACRGTGYSGRVGLYELLVMTDEIREGIARDVGRAGLRALAESSGMRPLRMDGYAKAHAGLTTIEEVHRVSQG